MIGISAGEDRNLLYALSWNNAQDAQIAFDVVTRSVVELNPAAEALAGFPRSELMNVRFHALHPEEERERADAEFLNAAGDTIHIHGLHIRHKDGRLIPVVISSSETWMLSGRMILICVYRDVTDQIEKEHRLLSQNWALSAYADATLAVGSARTAEGLLHSICEAITHESVYLAAWVGIAEDGPGKPVRVAASAGSAAGYIEGLKLSWSESEPEGRGPTGVCVRNGSLEIVCDAANSPNYGSWREQARQFGIRASISLPLCVEGGWRGALIVYSGRPNAFEAASVAVFERLGEQIVHAIRALDQQRQLEEERKNLAHTQSLLTEALSAMVTPIVAAMEMRDPYTSGHQGRVAEIACAIGKELGWAEERLHGLRVAALVHDIGKIAIPSEILTKPGKLSAAEWALICCHPETGYAILKDVPFSWPVADIVRQHHEKLDGSGYPGGLKADRILPEAKVLAVADVVEAMASFRPYRAGIDLDIVLKQIESEAGIYLDSEAVNGCLTLFRDRNFTVPGWMNKPVQEQGRGVARIL